MQHALSTNGTHLICHIVKKAELRSLETIGLSLECVIERFEQCRLDVVIEYF
jgi:hypothetical protein